ARDRALRQAWRVSDDVPRVLRHRAPHHGREDHRGAALPVDAAMRTATGPGLELRTERRLTAAYLVVALVALFGGVVTGLLQALEHAGVAFPAREWLLQSYYHSVSVHGVLNALVWTTFFICGFLPFITSRALGRPLASARLAWGTFWFMVAGLVV